ncbi:hypothetical protein OPV22_025184 [Ensete ventricosum]|uniref:Ornithine aminotransferase n=1 Tax=Ensete ventricosum TaxID=4639 RepID=A0AAV8Q6Q0_ENSVE|nr:hypothetical protein OPV22_025184 [Ensete ventricosum]
MRSSFLTPLNSVIFERGGEEREKEGADDDETHGCISEATAVGGKPDRRRKKQLCLAAEIPSLLFRGADEGHCHPKIVKALIDQAERLTLSSRAFYNDKFPTFAEHLTQMFGYEMMLPMNTGAETALKLAQKWSYEKKKIPKDEVRH